MIERLEEEDEYLGFEEFHDKKEEELDNDRNEHFYYYTKLLEDEENDKEKRAIALGYITEEQYRKYIEKLKKEIEKSKNQTIDELREKRREEWREMNEETKYLKKIYVGAKYFVEVMRNMVNLNEKIN